VIAQDTIDTTVVADSGLANWSAGNALMLAAYSACHRQGVACRLIDAR
jgi:hypothetical protein